MSIFKLLNLNCFKTAKIILHPHQNAFCQDRGFRKSYASILKIMKVRRDVIGPERVRRRSEWHDWNYQAELYSFPRRLQENISEETLRTAFIHDSYIKMEGEKRKALEMPQDVQFEMKSNVGLIDVGNNILNTYLFKYLSNCFPKLPKEGIYAQHNYLTSDDVLSHISFNIGTSELIFSKEYPPDKSTLSDSLKAIIGSIATDNNTTRAENFILDFVCPQLIAKDVFEIWDLEDPCNVLNSYLKKYDLQECESRLIFESGRNTMESVYHVGLYTNKKFLGRGPGETVSVAEEMAAYDALRRAFHVTESEQPLFYGDRAKSQNFGLKKNLPLIEWESDTFKKDLNL